VYIILYYITIADLIEAHRAVFTSPRSSVGALTALVALVALIGLIGPHGRRFQGSGGRKTYQVEVV
jgi:hypothetical protein